MKKWCYLLAFAMVISLTACTGAAKNEPLPEQSASVSTEVSSQEPETSVPQESAEESLLELDSAEESFPADGSIEAALPVKSEPEEETEPLPDPEPESQAEEETESDLEPNIELEPKPQPEPETNDKAVLVVIDAGHQAYGNSEKEPIGPGASESKAKVASGTSGCSTGMPEYELTLQVSLKLQEELKGRGYQVLMVRTENDVNLSNAERAEIANHAGADVFLRIHANGAEDSARQGAMTICQTKNNPYNSSIYPQSKLLSACVLDDLVAATGCEKEFVWETDTMSGINWCQVPVTIVEMGYMSNPEEDERMATAEYQRKIAEGIANGVDAYIASRTN